MDHPTIKRQKVEVCTTYQEEVLFNSDTLPKIISYLPSIDVLSLALTCKRFSISNDDVNDNNKPSLIEESARIVIKDLATEEELATLPYYNGESSLADYHYIQFIRAPLAFDQLVGRLEYVNSGDKSCVKCSNYSDGSMGTAFSNNVLLTGKHYVTFQAHIQSKLNLLLGVMRPGQANHNASKNPLYDDFYQNFSQNMGSGECNNDINCCLYYTNTGFSYSSNWGESDPNIAEMWSGWEPTASGDELGMLLDLDEGTLSVYKNGRKLGVMKRGLAGPYCWVVSMCKGEQVTIKRGTIPPS